MDSRQHSLFTFFCPLCRNHQKTRVVKKLSLLHHLQFGLLATVFTWATWGSLGVKGASVYLLIWAVFEFQYRLRKRAEFICRTCGFDPFLYQQDAEKTRAVVQAKLQAKILEEGLFQGKKLKNYQTRPIAGAETPTASNSSTGGSAAPNAAPAHETKARAELTR